MGSPVFLTVLQSNVVSPAINAWASSRTTAASSTRLSMGIFDDVTAEMKTAMKEKDKSK